MRIEDTEAFIQLTKNFISGKTQYLNGELSKITSLTTEDERKGIIDKCKTVLIEIEQRLNQLHTTI